MFLLYLGIGIQDNNTLSEISSMGCVNSLNSTSILPNWLKGACSVLLPERPHHNLNVVTLSHPKNLYDTREKRAGGDFPNLPFENKVKVTDCA